jgi:hypothetical protein
MSHSDPVQQSNIIRHSRSWYINSFLVQRSNAFRYSRNWCVTLFLFKKLTSDPVEAAVSQTVRDQQSDIKYSRSCYSFPLQRSNAIRYSRNWCVPLFLFNRLTLSDPLEADMAHSVPVQQSNNIINSRSWYINSFLVQRSNAFRYSWHWCVTLFLFKKLTLSDNVEADIVQSVSIPSWFSCNIK